MNVAAVVAALFVIAVLLFTGMFALPTVLLLGALALGIGIARHVARRRRRVGP